jgi:tRNA A-37 threonylcarbamoyl transferase component Bud32
MLDQTRCPAPLELERFLLGLVPDAEAAVWEDHVGTCPACDRVCASLSGEDDLVATLRQSPVLRDRMPQGAAVESLRLRLRRLPWGGDTGIGISVSGSSDSDLPVVGDTEILHAFLAPPEAPDELGRLGPCRILKVLGTGGMGIVFLAEDLQLRRPVAVKALRPALAVRQSARERFLREARSAAAGRHEHIVTIYQVGEDRSIPFLVMECLEGESLEDRLRREGRLPVPEVLRIGCEIAKGLAAAHTRGLIHQDIKPANVFLSSDPGRSSLAESEGLPRREHGQGTKVKLLDFGLAQLASEVEQQALAGRIAGTPAYMAPEQARAEAVDYRCDLFGLGCVLYRLCTGDLPFQGADKWATLRAVERDNPRPPRVLNPLVPRPLSDLVMRLLAKRPEDRPASAREVVAALERITPDPRAAWRRLLVQAVAAAVLLGAVGFAGVWLAPLVWRPQPGGAPDDSQAAPVAPFQSCHFAPQVAYAVGPQPYHVAVGDFNGDGKPDLVVTDWYSLAVFLNNGDGTFRRGVNLAADSNFPGVAVGDFNGDGVLDLAVTQPNADCLSVYLGRGDGTFREPRRYTTSSSPWGVAVGDFDGDGRLDVAVSTKEGKKVSILLGNGDGTFRPTADYPCQAGGAISLAVADFNGDGKPDLVASHGSLDRVLVFLGNGDGTFRPGVPYAVGSGPGVVVVADFNGDGKPDLAVENVGNNNVSVLLGNGDGTFQLAVHYPAGTSPGGLAVADFNGDGKPDLVVANHESHNVSVLLGNGDGSFRPAIHYAAGWTPAGVAVADLDGDGKPDIAVANVYGGSLSVLLNRPPAPHFRLVSRNDVFSGEFATVNAIALDAHGNPDTHFAGAIRVTCSDAQAEVRDGEKKDFGPKDNGVLAFGFTPKKTGAQTLTVVDGGNGSPLGMLTILVKPNPASRFRIIAPLQCQAGVGFRVSVFAQDGFETQTPGYVGTVRLTSSDPKAGLPPDYKFVSEDDGACRLPLTLRTPGEQTITITDIAKGAIVGRTTVDVTP